MWWRSRPTVTVSLRGVQMKLPRTSLSWRSRHGGWTNGTVEAQKMSSEAQLACCRTYVVRRSAMWYRSVNIGHLAAAADRARPAGRHRGGNGRRSGQSRVTFITARPAGPAGPSNWLRFLVIKSPIYVARPSLIGRTLWHGACMADGGKPLCAALRADKSALDADSSADITAHRPVQTSSLCRVCSGVASLLSQARRTCSRNQAEITEIEANKQCGHPPRTLTVDCLTFKLVCESHLRCEIFFPKLTFAFSNYSLCTRRKDRQTDG